MVDADASVAADRSITVVLADDDEMLREALAYMLDAQLGLRVVGQASNGREAVEVAAREHPDVVVMDIRMPELDGFAATRQIRDVGIDTRVLLLTTFEDDDYVVTGIRSGADGFMLKRSGPDEFRRAILTVARGDALVDPLVTRSLLSRWVEPPGQSVDLAQRYHLTSREIDVLAELVKGSSNAAIAKRLGTSELTVKSHLSRLFAKIGCQTRVQAVVFAYDTGLVTPKPPPAP